MTDTPRSRAPLIWTAAALIAGAAVAGGAYLYKQRSEEKAYETALMKVAPDRLLADPPLYFAAAKKGAAVFAENCTSCHGADLKGDSAKGVPALNDEYWLYGGGFVSELEHTVANGIRSGHKDDWHEATMPAFATARPFTIDGKEKLYVDPLNAQEIDEVAEYVLALNKQPHDTAKAERGKVLWDDKGGCYDCHADDGFGNTAIGAPGFLENDWLYGKGTKADIVASISGGRAGVCPAWIDKLGPVKVRELAAFIKSRSKLDPWAVPPWELDPPRPEEEHES